MQLSNYLLIIMLSVTISLQAYNPVFPITRAYDRVASFMQRIYNVPTRLRQGIASRFSSVEETVTQKTIGAIRAGGQELTHSLVKGFDNGVTEMGFGKRIQDGITPILEQLGTQGGQAGNQFTHNLVQGLDAGITEMHLADRIQGGIAPVMRELGTQGGQAVELLAHGGGNAMAHMGERGGEVLEQLAHNGANAMRTLTTEAGIQMEEVSLHGANAIENLGEGYGRAMVPVINQLSKMVVMTGGPVLAGTLLYFAGKKYIQKFMYEPGLIERRSSYSMLSGMWSALKNTFGTPKTIDQIIRENMVISDKLAAELNYIMRSTSKIKEHGGNFENILLYGAPGTGKTLFAQLLALHCGMDYAIVPAANVSQFLANGQAVEELNRLFDWAVKSSRGTIIFFDEAETFLKDRSKLSDAAHNALGAFLVKTGTPSDKIMVVCATNVHPSQLDAAALSRLGMRIEFPLPDVMARKDQLIMHIDRIFGNQKSGSVVAYEHLQDETILRQIAERLEGCSGRTIQKFVNRLRQRALAEDSLVITPDFVEHAIEQLHRDQKVEKAAAIA
ncbi:AAA family ATPase [Candidatus Dependentiae bacterium]|nr:AAA family ATPase [Candidatus Dependentiae bacterium]